MKKIKVSTVQKQADVQVIFVDASLISKALRAQIALERIIEMWKNEGCIAPRYETPMNDNGIPERDEHGDVKYVPSLDENGKQIIDYTGAKLTGDEVAVLNENVFAFLTELTNAFDE